MGLKLLESQSSCDHNKPPSEIFGPSSTSLLVLVLVLLLMPVLVLLLLLVRLAEV